MREKVKTKYWAITGAQAGWRKINVGNECKECKSVSNVFNDVQPYALVNISILLVDFS